MRSGQLLHEKAREGELRNMSSRNLRCALLNRFFLIISVLQVPFVRNVENYS